MATLQITLSSDERDRIIARFLRRDKEKDTTMQRAQKIGMNSGWNSAAYADAYSEAIYQEARYGGFRDALVAVLGEDGFQTLFQDTRLRNRHNPVVTEEMILGEQPQEQTLTLNEIWWSSEDAPALTRRLDYDSWLTGDEPLENQQNTQVYEMSARRTDY